MIYYLCLERAWPKTGIIWEWHVFLRITAESSSAEVPFFLFGCFLYWIMLVSYEGWQMDSHVSSLSLLFYPFFSRNLPCVPNDSKWFTPTVDPSISNIFINGNWSMANPSPNCQCSTPQKTTMLPDCPPGAGGLPPPQVSPQSVNPRSACNIMVSNRNTWPLAWNVCLIWQPGLDLKTCVSSPN